MATPDYWAPNMASLTGNTGGAVQVLPASYQVNGRDKHIEVITLSATYTALSLIAIARVPLYSTLTGISVVADTSLGTNQALTFGDLGTAVGFGSGIYGVSGLMTAANITVNCLKAAKRGTQITAGYDSLAGASSADHEDIVMQVGTGASLSAGTLIVTEVSYSLM